LRDKAIFANAKYFTYILTTHDSIVLKYHFFISQLPELMRAYSTYGTGLGASATVLANKMTFQLFAKFVLETPVPKGHLDMTSLLLAPLEVTLTKSTTVFPESNNRIFSFLIKTLPMYFVTFPH
jgi:hypothetical protein